MPLNIQPTSKMTDANWQQHAIHSSPIPLMSVTLPSTVNSTTSPSSRRTSLSEPTCSSIATPRPIVTDPSSSTSTLADHIDISKFHFAHVIKIPHGTNLLASDNHSTTLCSNSSENIIHLITPTGYHIRSLRWPEAEEKVMDLLWCETVQAYLAATPKSLHVLRYDTTQALHIERSLDFPADYLSTKVTIACNTYRLYTYGQSMASIDIYTLHFAHLHTKQLPTVLVTNPVVAFTCSDTHLVFNYRQLTHKLIVLNSTTMIITHQFDLSYQNISSLRCFDEKTLVLTTTRKDGENRLVFLQYEEEAGDTQPVIVEKSLPYDQQTVHLLPNGRDLMILTVSTARVQYMKYRS